MTVNHERLRDKRRRDGKLTYDCFNLKQRGDVAYCSKGYALSLADDGSLELEDVLKGVTSGVCRTCKDFDGEEDEV